MPQRFGVPLPVLLELDVDEVARLLVAHLEQTAVHGAIPNSWNVRNQVRVEADEEGYGDDVWKAAALKIATAWQWLRTHLFLVDHPEHSGEWEALTPQAAQLANAEYLLDVRASDLLGGVDLDSELRRLVDAAFRRGAYRVAVLAAFAHLETRVAETANLRRGLRGQDLMIQAFKPNGPLADPALEDSENMGRAYLFAGAMGAIRNPRAHNVAEEDAAGSAAALILFANTLLGIVSEVELRR